MNQTPNRYQVYRVSTLSSNEGFSTCTLLLGYELADYLDMAVRNRVDLSEVCIKRYNGDEHEQDQ